MGRLKEVKRVALDEACLVTGMPVENMRVVLAMKQIRANSSGIEYPSLLEFECKPSKAQCDEMLDITPQNEDNKLKFSALEMFIECRDVFSRKLLLGGIRVLSDDENEIGIHLFASALREIFNYHISKMADDILVKKCSWFKLDKGRDKPTNTQRLRYIVGGGFSNKIFEEIFDKSEYGKLARKVSSLLGSFNAKTHVRPGTLTDIGKRYDLASGMLNTAKELLTAVRSLKNNNANKASNLYEDKIKVKILKFCQQRFKESSPKIKVKRYRVFGAAIYDIDNESVRYQIYGEIIGDLGGSLFLSTMDISAKAPVRYPASINPYAATFNRVGGPGCIIWTDGLPEIVQSPL